MENKNLIYSPTIIIYFTFNHKQQADLLQNKWGEIVSRKKHLTAKKEMDFGHHGTGISPSLDYHDT